MSEDRRHIAVMFTDIVGYTALMGSNEDNAFDMLKRNHTIHATLIEKHNGTLIKEVGDGTLASFSLGSDAVRCAMDIQKEAKNKNIPLKIGIHEGEMVMAGQDVIGDGVNIASRLQEISAQGSIIISGRVYEDVKNKAGIQTKFIGDKRLKNVEDPVRVYEVQIDNMESPQIPTRKFYIIYRNSILTYFIPLGLVIIIIFLWLNRTKIFITSHVVSEEIKNEKISVAVFNNYTNDENLDALGNMASEWITYGLRKLGAEVSSPEMMRRYKNNVGILPDNPQKEASLVEITGAKYVVTGSFYLKGDSIQVTSRLESTQSGEILHDFPTVWGHVEEKELLIEEIVEKFKGYWAVKTDQSLIKLNPPKYEAYKAFINCGGGYFNLDCHTSALEIDSTFLLARIFLTWASWVHEEETLNRKSHEYVINHWDQCTDYGKNFFDFYLNQRKLNYLAAAEAIEKNLALDSRDLWMLHEAAFFRSFLNMNETTLDMYGIIFDNFDIYKDHIWRNVYHTYFYNLNSLGRHIEVIDFAQRQPIDIHERMNEYARGEIIRALLVERKFDEIKSFLELLDKNDLKYIINELAYIYNTIFPDDTLNIFENRVSANLDKYQIVDPCYTGPLHMNNWVGEAGRFYVLREWDKAETELLDLRKTGCREFFEPDAPFLWYTIPWMEGFLGCVYARQGKKEDAIEQIHKLESMRKDFPDIANVFHRGMLSYGQARIYALVDDKDQAVEALRKSLDEGRGFIYQKYVFDWDLTNLKGYPPFEELVRPK